MDDLGSWSCGRMPSFLHKNRAISHPHGRFRIWGSCSGNQAFLLKNILSCLPTTIRRSEIGGLARCFNRSLRHCFNNSFLATYFRFTGIFSFSFTDVSSHPTFGTPLSGKVGLMISTKNSSDLFSTPLPRKVSNFASFTLWLFSPSLIYWSPTRARRMEVWSRFAINKK